MKVYRVPDSPFAGKFWITLTAASNLCSWMDLVSSSIMALIKNEQMAKLNLEREEQEKSWGFSKF